MNKFLISVAHGGGLVLATPDNAQTGRVCVNIGTLPGHENCGWGFIVNSSRLVNRTCACKDRGEHYDGTISECGVDVGYRQSGVPLCGAIAPGDQSNFGTPEGSYRGVTAVADLCVQFRKDG